MILKYHQRSLFPTVHDLHLIQTFIRESLQRRELFLSTPTLKAHHLCGLNQLIGVRQGLVATVALEKEPLTVFVKSDSYYSNLMHHLLAEERFLRSEVQAEAYPVVFWQYTHVQPVQGYQFHCTAPKVLWMAWWRSWKQLQQQGLCLDLLIWTRNNWYPLRSLTIQEGKIYIKTLPQEIVLSSQESIVWLEKIKTRQEPPLPNHTAYREQTKGMSGKQQLAFLLQEL